MGVAFVAGPSGNHSPLAAAGEARGAAAGQPQEPAHGGHAEVGSWGGRMLDGLLPHEQREAWEAMQRLTALERRLMEVGQRW